MFMCYAYITLYVDNISLQLYVFLNVQDVYISATDIFISKHP